MDCGICQNNIENADKISSIYGCTHIFHPICLDRWDGPCPMCRAKRIEPLEIEPTHVDGRMLTQSIRSPEDFNRVFARVRGLVETPNEVMTFERLQLAVDRAFA